MATPNKSSNSGAPVTGQSVTARTGTLGTVHHLAPGGTVRTTATPFANLQQGILAMSMQSAQKSTSSHGTVTIPKLTTTKLVTSPSPRKKIKLEEVPPANSEIASSRQKLLDEKLWQMKEVKESYVDNLTECFFLQNGGQLMDFFVWRKRPTPQLVEFLRSGRLDSDDEDDNPLQYLEKRNEETKPLTGSVATVTPVATSTTLPASFAALSQPGSDTDLSLGGRHGMVFGHMRPPLPSPVSMSVASSSHPGTMSSSLLSMSGSGTLHKSLSDSKLLTLAQSTKMVMSSQTSGTKMKSPSGSPGRSRQNSSDGTNIKGISSQEAIVERAKQEAQVMSRVAELRKEGLWSSRRLPKVQEPPRAKAHWDYLLEEMQWLAADFQQERKWKKTAARKLAKMVQKHFQELEQKELRAEKEEGMKLKRIAGQLAKMVKEFWSNIEKVVQYKQNSRLDEKRKKAMDLHLNFIVDQTEKYSSWLTEGLAQSSKGSSGGSRNTTPDPSVAGDDEFKPEGGDTDDEETIEKDEEGIDEAETQNEVEALQKESELPIEQLIESLPKEILEKPADINQQEIPMKKKDKEFEVDEDESEEDMEDTIDEQEQREKPDEVKREIDDLKDECEMSIDELREKYAAAYDSDFEMPKDSGDESTDIDDDEETTTEGGEEEGDEEEEEEEEEDVDIEGEDPGLEMLMETDEKPKEKQEEKEKEVDKDRELTDIAAEAARLQPKGYTLQTTDVKVKVPFLIKHTLREYQHVGLDWLATMYEKRLNGILADEMGLGKTIQTIALLAHLACEKGIWGPHLIVVPTSVMLNWEMEIQKWCPSFKILTYYGSQKERKQKRTGWTKTNAFHICITSYKLVIQDHQAFRRKKWKYLILDEAQNIKNFKSRRWQCLLNFNSYRRLLLTGTPLQNSLMELWSLMHFLMPHVFQSHRDFKEWFANPLTGMIEGSHEYNENLVRRLHKVLRPFLLRRLKDDVEKQMPKKYEHIVMCHLSKRQRFLYEEFMAQGKTKETLASGHFMSVINILMQLRKVCNHPSLFDPRPIISPFQMEGIVYHTSSMVKKVMEYNPLEDIQLHRYPGLAEMERDLPAFIAHRVRKLQTNRRLIEEIDTEKAPPSRPPPGKLKANSIRCISPALQVGRASSPAVLGRSVSPSPVITPPIKTTAVPVTSVTGTVPPLQATVSPQTSTTLTTTAVSTSSQQSPAISQPITVQIQHTDQGTRLVVPSGQLSQLPGFLQIVQTSTGQHLIATSTPVSSATSTSTANSSVTSTGQPSTASPTSMSSVTSTSFVVNGSPVVTVASFNSRPEVSSSVSQVKMSAVVQSVTSPTVQLPTSTTLNTTQKPVMRVSPLADIQSHGKKGNGLVFTAATTSSTTSCVMSTSTKPVPVPAGPSPQYLKHIADQKKKMQKKEFFLEALYEKEVENRRKKLSAIAQTNKQHCDLKPVYGQDLCDAINIFKDPYSGRVYRARDRSKWNGPGHIHCHCAKLCLNPCHPKYLWNQTKVLSDVIHTPEQYLEELKEVIERYVFLTPPVQTPQIKMHLSHPPPSFTMDERYRDHLIRTKLSPKASNYHKISTNMTVQFPELRLIQYDCGKLQTLDILLHRLKSGDHRVLIFTQMTRMLDILESFLNYHGYRYLRLDGTTKVEQRQQLMDRFNADRRIFVFILSTRSGGVGVNLTGADTVIFYDSDWNPTMDAQAQDRCHRIGQTRDVHIYRLVSERTVEENILKKANQKRMLGDMAIEGGNFTTSFFKQNTIDELFSEPSGLDSLVKEKEEEEKRKEEKKVAEKKKKVDTSESAALAQFEKALANTEDETDAVAIDVVKAEQKAELAEFDENIPWDEREAEIKEGESHVEQELSMLEKELTPIERYAVLFAELQMDPVNAEELELAEEDIENVKKDWELNRLKALKEEEERRAELEEDEMLYTYSRDDAYQQVFLSDVDNEQMPMWAPPTPPHDDNDVYLDETLLFLYEPSVMPETQLPPVYVKKEKRKVKVESITTRKQKQRKEEQLRVPRSLFDRPTAQLLKLRRDAKIQKLKMGQMKPYRPLPTLPQKPMMDQTPDHPEWLIHEDWALLQAVQNFFDVPLNLMIVNPAHTPNWDMVADVVNSCSRVYRSAKHCRLRYETVIIPREEGKIMYDLNPRKQKKQKGIYKMPKSSRAMKTGQIHSQDSNNGLTILYSLRFESVKGIANKRPPTMRQTLINPTLKNPKHASVLQENGISYDQPLNPMQVAEIRAERIQREKKQNQQQQAAAASAATDQTTAVAGTPLTGGIQRAVQNVVPQPQVSQPTIVALTSGVTATQLATIGTAASSATVLTVTGTPLAQATIRQRAPLTVQEIGTGATVVGQVANTVSQVRAQLQGTATSIAPTLQLAQRITAATSAVNTVPAQLQAQSGKPLTQQQIQLFQQQTLLNRQKQAMLQQQQQQQFKMQKVTIDPRQQQQLQQVKRQVVQGQKTVIHQQLVTSMTQGPLKQGAQMARTLTSEEIARLNKQQQQKLASGQALVGTQIQQAGQGAQIIGTSMQPVSQALSKVSAQQAGATLVKTVSAPPGNVSINVSMPQKGKVSQLSQMQLLQQRKPIPVQKGLTTGQKMAPQMVSAVQIIQQQTRGGSLTVQQLQQIMKQQMIHTSQPTIIATVTQSQATPQMVTKVLATTANLQPSQIQSVPSATVISGQSASSSTASPVYTLSQVSVPSLPSGQSSMTASIVKPGLGKGGDAVTTVQIHPISSIGQQSKLTGVPQSVIVQPVQSIQHVTVAAPIVTQQQVPVATQQVTVAAPAQTLQMTVPANSAATQHITIPHTSHVTVSAQRALSNTSSPMTVTLTPAAHQAITQSVAPNLTTVTIPGTSTQSHVVTTQTQAGTVSEQLAQQTVATILQRQPAVQVQRTPVIGTAASGTVQQSGSQTIHIQSPVASQTVVQSGATGQGQADAQSPQTTPQGKSSAYGIRTRNQSKPQ